VQADPTKNGWDADPIAIIKDLIKMEIIARTLSGKEMPDKWHFKLTLDGRVYQGQVVFSLVPLNFMLFNPQSRDSAIPLGIYKGKEDSESIRQHFTRIIERLQSVVDTKDGQSEASGVT
jgi:hypothetical protein